VVQKVVVRVVGKAVAHAVVVGVVTRLLALRTLLNTSDGAGRGLEIPGLAKLLRWSSFPRRSVLMIVLLLFCDLL
jgi:hypothetical protein